MCGASLRNVETPNEPVLNMATLQLSNGVNCEARESLAACGGTRWSTTIRR
jgi:hypothetical protein